ncbi:Flippase-like domain-containing protein [Halorhabdus sp. BNX81]|nr:Flippase-like domain-containing protein [Halorhabdus sp. BNX81]
MSDVTESQLRDMAVTLAQYVIALVALAWAASQTDPAEAASLLAGLDPLTALALLAVTVLGLLARFDTWAATLAPIQPTDRRTAGRVDLIVNFVNQLLPSRLTGRLAAPFVLRSKLGISYADATAVSGVHTALYAVLYGAVATVGLALAVGRLSIGLATVLALSIALYLLAGAVVLAAGTNLERLDWVFGGVTRLLGYLPKVGDRLAAQAEDAVSFTADATVAFRRIALDPGVWVRYTAGWVVAMVLAPGARVLLLLAGFGVAFEPAALVPLYLVMAYSVTLLPLTPGGFGVTEATTTAVFVALGVPSAAIVPVVFVDRFLGVYLPALAGWYPALGIDRASLRSGEEG